MQHVDRPITVVMVMNNVLYRQGLSMLLESGGDVTVVAQAGSCDVALETVQRVAPDVVIIELADSDEAFRADDIVVCAGASPDSGIVLLGSSETPTDVLELFEAGIRGYVLKQNQAETLIDAVRAVARGEYVVDTHVVGSLLELMKQMRSKLDACCPGGERDSLLTARQQELLRLVAEGLTNRQIAATLGISESTVKNHLYQVFSKLGVTSRSQAISVGVRIGVLRP